MGSFVSENESLWKAIDAVVRDEGVTLYDLEVLGDRTLRVTIDKPKSEAAPEGKVERVTSGDCSRVCRRLMVYFQAEGPGLGFSAEPQIEVSSPGVNRALRLRRHFEEAAGERVKIVYTAGAEGASADGPSSRTVLGILEAVQGESVQIADEQSHSSVAVPLAQVKRASVEFKF